MELVSERTGMPTSSQHVPAQCVQLFISSANALPLCPPDASPGVEDNSSTSSSNGSLLDSDSDLVFVAKLTAVSVVGGAAVKYGSLLSPLAFSQNEVVALALVLAPPIIYAAMLLTRPSDSKQ